LNILGPVILGSKTVQPVLFIKNLNSTKSLRANYFKGKMTSGKNSQIVQFLGGDFLDPLRNFRK
jgi:hypothetical protein